MTAVVSVISGTTGAAVATGFFGLRRARIESALAERNATRQDAATDRGDLWKRISELEQAGRADASAHRAELAKLEHEHEDEVREFRAEVKQLTIDLRTKDAEIFQLRADLRIAMLEIETMRAQLATGAGKRPDGTYVTTPTAKRTTEDKPS